MGERSKMIILTGTSLNKRHQELNTKVNEAAKSEINFEEVKDGEENSDVDKLFKIDLASKYRNIDYILEVLKSGDNLYISRALKCYWIVDDEFSQFINPQYLERNIFPFISLKMKKKLLATLSTRILNSERAEEFHHYCMRNRMYKLGMNFLLYTNESFKIEVLTLHPHVYNDFNRNDEYVENFIGNSFLLADYYLKVVSESLRSTVLYKLRYLYSVSEEQYLDLLETYLHGCTERYDFRGTSIRLSRDIMRKHKKRVLKEPWIYLHTLNHEVVTKYSNSDDAKVYAIGLLPETCNDFWHSNYNCSNEFFLKLIPLGERFNFIKKIFTEKYPGEKFEENYDFYTYNFHDMMTRQEKEDWALRHVATGQELHGSGNDYIWYQFVNFEKSFIELKKYILITPDSTKRTSILKTLVDSAKNQEELKTLLEYYYDRHNNELREHKRGFINKLIETHNVLNFNDECWSSLEKIFYSIEVYHKLSEDNNDYQNNQYRMISLVYYIIHDKPVKEILHEYILSHIITVSDLRWGYEQHLDPIKLDKVFKYMLPFLTNHVETLMQVKNKENVDKINRYIEDVLDLISSLNKKFEDIPTFILNYVMSEDVFEIFQHYRLFEHLRKTPPEFKMGDIMHYLKEDATLVVSKFPAIKKYFQEKRPKRNINWLIRKLAIYFRHDIAPEYVKLLNDCLSVEELYLQTARVVAFGIFNLTDETYKISFLEKYVPADSKIDHVNISRDLLTIQTAICSVACQSRPPLPLPSVRRYINGDYVQYCIPIFDSYLANLTPDQCLGFVESLLDSPVSVQKHGLRLAFHCFSVENLKNLVLKVWKKTKNVSLRKILYKALFHKVDYYHDKIPAQWELFEVLTIMTLDLNQDDDNEVFRLLSTALPPTVCGQHLQSAYIVVSTFPKKAIHYEYLSQIVLAMECHLQLISDKVLLAIMEDHVNTMLEQDFILSSDLQEDDKLSELVDRKWSLIKSVIIKQKNMHYIYLITEKILVKWYKTHDDVYIYRKFYIQSIISDLESRSYRESAENYVELNNIFRAILYDLENAFPSIEIYFIVWGLKLNIIMRQILGEELPKINKDENEAAKAMIKETIIKISHQVKDLMKEYIESKKYFQSFSGDLQSLLHIVICTVNELVRSFFNDPNDKDYCWNDIYVLLCSVLVQYDVREIHLFVMSFLPLDYTGKYSTEYLDVINKLKSLDDEEVKYYLCDKFYSNDFTYRNFMARPSG